MIRCILTPGSHRGRGARKGYCRARVPAWTRGRRLHRVHLCWRGAPCYARGRMTLRIAAFVLVVACARAGVAAETARQILDRRKALEDTTQHWNDRHQRMKMRIIDHRGGERVRELEVYDRRESGAERKTILFFLTPAEVKGTGFLSFTHTGRPADQW